MHQTMHIRFCRCASFYIPERNLTISVFPHCSHFIINFFQNFKISEPGLWKRPPRIWHVLWKNLWKLLKITCFPSLVFHIFHRTPCGKTNVTSVRIRVFRHACIVSQKTVIHRHASGNGKMHTDSPSNPFSIRVPIGAVSKKAPLQALSLYDSTIAIFFFL